MRDEMLGSGKAALMLTTRFSLQSGGLLRVGSVPLRNLSFDSSLLGRCRSKVSSLMCIPEGFSWRRSTPGSQFASVGQFALIKLKGVHVNVDTVVKG